MSKKPISSVRLFSDIPAADTRPVIETPNGPIYAGTPEAAQWQAMKDYVDPLKALADSFGTMTFEKATALQEIAALLPKLPASQARLSATLHDLSEAMQGRLANRTGCNYREPDAAYAGFVSDLRGFAARAVDSLSSLVHHAPKPPHPDAPKTVPLYPLGTDPAWRLR